MADWILPAATAAGAITATYLCCVRPMLRSQHRTTTRPVEDQPRYQATDAPVPAISDSDSTGGTSPTQRPFDAS